MNKFFVRKISALLLGIPALGCLSCNKDLNLPVVVDIPVAFQIAMNEKLQPGPHPLELELSSLEVLDCTNYAIVYHLEQGSHEIHLTLTDWVLSEPCEPGSGVAKDVLNLGVLPNGDYKLLISLKDVVHNEGILLVRPVHFSIRMETAHGVLINPTTLHRLPENTIWGGVYPKVDSLTTLADSFLNDLTAMVSPDVFSPGIYGPFEISSNQEITLHDGIEKGEGTTFVFNYPGNRDDLINLVNYYRAVGADGLKIYLFDEDGFTY